ncbi:unnamed protein product [Brachionus calyciflorus]|uniref:Mediator of RNA polymerase II transcription subunit 7 n=1 Tax=Brachionus calyciflorus TaxID=104777 RepID=A0A813U1L4_9BILA|nr:unnamed protein product [Brachionus calyciflorus]
MMDNQHFDEPPTAQLSSTYPSAPMEYVNMYTNENVKSGKAPPPPKIIKDNYTSFGRLIDPNEVLIRPLESQGIQQLYSLQTPDQSRPHLNTNNYKRELKKLNHSILIAYLDLLEVLVKAPNTQIQIEQAAPIQLNELGEPIQNPEPIVIIKTLREQKLEDLEVLFINMHHLINELRPHQARDNIRCILEMQKQQRIELAEKFKEHLRKIVDLLKHCIDSIRPEVCAKQSTLMNELSNLIKNANQLTKSLDKFSPNKTNGYHIQDESDIEMREMDTERNNLINLVNITSNKLSQQKINNNNNNEQSIINNKNCDIKDLILCDLIDDFLIKENEF